MTDVFSAATRYLSIILICIYMIIAFLSMGNISKAGKRKAARPVHHDHPALAHG